MNNPRAACLPFGPKAWLLTIAEDPAIIGDRDAEILAHANCQMIIVKLWRQLITLPLAPGTESHVRIKLFGRELADLRACSSKQFPRPAKLAVWNP
jgi:hypothetical protein